MTGWIVAGVVVLVGILVFVALYVPSRMRRIVDLRMQAHEAKERNDQTRAYAESQAAQARSHAEILSAQARSHTDLMAAQGKLYSDLQATITKGHAEFLSQVGDLKRLTLTAINGRAETDRRVAKLQERDDDHESRIKALEARLKS